MNRNEAWRHCFEQLQEAIRRASVGDQVEALRSIKAFAVVNLGAIGKQLARENMTDAEVAAGKGPLPQAGEATDAG